MDEGVDFERGHRTAKAINSSTPGLMVQGEKMNRITLNEPFCADMENKLLE